MAKKKKQPETTEHGALKVTTGGEDYDLELRWADKVLGLRWDDVEELRAVAEDYEHRAIEPDPHEKLNDLADRIEGALP